MSPDSPKRQARRAVGPCASGSACAETFHKARPFVDSGHTLKVASLVAMAPMARAATAPSGLRVVGNQLVAGASGGVVRLIGVNRSGTEYQCIHGYGIFEGPSGAASVQAIADWQANAVRIPLNE